ncbi:hypothetical protein [Arthrobacter mobilis]|uniref:Uncharacterized protein n=1 Tax=Arthrobacter mobilis TaxID=2724944 RepID=A0A7X6HGV4_9MICC|nr:hypothetical protein [Arthrobacter mobilis]NKX55923.1 hypothetical protein [Arthrobacter mobilis]
MNTVTTRNAQTAADSRYERLKGLTPEVMRRASTWTFVRAMHAFLDQIEDGFLDGSHPDVLAANDAFWDTWNGLPDEVQVNVLCELGLREAFGDDTHCTGPEETTVDDVDREAFEAWRRVPCADEQAYFDARRRKVRVKNAGSYRSSRAGSRHADHSLLPNAGKAKCTLGTGRNSIKGAGHSSYQETCAVAGADKPARDGWAFSLKPASSFFDHDDADAEPGDAIGPGLCEESKQRIVKQFSSEAIKAMENRYRGLDLSPIIEAQCLLTLLYSDALADTLTNDMIARHLQTLAEMHKAAWHEPLRAVWKKEFAPAQHGKIKGRVGPRNSIDYGVAHLHLWIAQPPAGRSAYGRRSPYHSEFSGWPYHTWLAKVWRRITGQDNAREKLTRLPSAEEVRKHWCADPADAVNKMVRYFKKTGKGTIRKRFQNRVPDNWLARGEHGTKFYGYLGLSRPNALQNDARAAA